MAKYRIVSEGSEFQVVENLPDGRSDIIGGFRSEADAESWLDSFLVLLGLIDCIGGHQRKQARTTRFQLRQPASVANNRITARTAQVMSTQSPNRPIGRVGSSCQSRWFLYRGPSNPFNEPRRKLIY
jgi:hypothetical protein